MNYIKRAFFSICKRKSRTVLLAVVFFIIATLIFSGISVRSAAQREEYAARMSLGSSVTVMLDSQKVHDQYLKAQKEGKNSDITVTTGSSKGTFGFQSDGISEKIYKNIAQSKYVTDYNLFASQMVTSGNFKKVSECSNYYDAIVIGFSDTSLASEFSSGEYRLVAGRHITRADSGKKTAVISKALADKNHFKLGDTISIKTCETKKNPAKAASFKIVGMFAELKPQNAAEKYLYKYSESNPNERIFTDFMDANNLDSDNGLSSVIVTYFLDDTAHISDFTKYVGKFLDMNYYSATSNEKMYKAIEGPLNSVAILMNILVLISVIAGCVIMSLITALYLKERGYEFGILLSIGEKKLKIAAQMFLEVLVPVIAAVCLAIAVNGIVARQAGLKLLNNEISQSRQKTVVSQSDTISGMNGYVVGDTKTDPASNFNFALTPQQAAESAGAAVLIVLISVVIPTVSILRFNPRKILAKA